MVRYQRVDEPMPETTPISTGRIRKRQASSPSPKPEIGTSRQTLLIRYWPPMM
jgi:hypothetical protein